MEIITYVKDTPALLLIGVLTVFVFGWLLRRRYFSFDFTRRYSKLLYILDNYEFVGGAIIGIVLILFAIFG